MSGAARALFLDRDGVINRDDAGYTWRWEEFVFIDGIFDVCRHARARGFSLFVVTNQAGIGRGYYSEQDFLDLSAKMCAEFERQGAAIDKVYYSPYHPEYGVGRYKQESFLRKPNPGMILLAAEEFALSLAGSVLVGDKPSDIRAGVSAGVGCNLLYRPGGGGAGEGGASAEATAVLAELAQVKAYLD